VALATMQVILQPPRPAPDGGGHWHLRPRIAQDAPARPVLPNELAHAPRPQRQYALTLGAIQRPPALPTERKCMTDTTQEIATMDFNCPAAGKLVVIHSTYAIRVSRAGKRLGRQATETDCSNQDHCLIATHGPEGVTHDWAKCVYLHPATD
jgi:hypothetical protein